MGVVLYRPACLTLIKLRFDTRLTVTSSSPGESKTEPLITQADGDSFVYARIPDNGNFNFPGYRKFGKFDMEYKFRDMPIDPRTVAGAFVEIYTDTISDNSFRDGMRGIRSPSGSLASVLNPTKYSEIVNAQNFRMAGFVDEWEVEYPKGGAATVRLTGRDIRGVLMDTPIAAGKDRLGAQILDDLDFSKPIHQVVKQLLSFNPAFADIKVIVLDAEWPDGVLAPYSSDIIPEYRKRRKGGSTGGKPNTSEVDRMSFWDVIVKLCYFVGALPTLQGVDIVIRPVKSIYDKLNTSNDPTRMPTPFSRGMSRTFDAASGTALRQPLRVRRMAYGRDVDSLKYSRKFAGWSRPKYVRAVSFDPDATDIGADGRPVRTRIAFYPELPEELVTKEYPNGKIKESEIVTIPVAGITDLQRLKSIAQAVYEEAGRGEVGGEFETKSLASFGGDASDPDLLRLLPGDGVELLVDTAATRQGTPLQGAMVDAVGKPFEEAVADVVSVMGDENLARVVIATTRGQINELPRFFRVSNVAFDIGDKGISVSCTFENYIEASDNFSNVSPTPGTAQRIEG